MRYTFAICVLLLAVAGCQGSDSPSPAPTPRPTAGPPPGTVPAPAPEVTTAGDAGQTRQADGRGAEDSVAATPPGAIGEARKIEADSALSGARELSYPAGSGSAFHFAPTEPPAWRPYHADRENYRHLADNPLHLTIANPLSTFSIDVDTASYSNVRRLLNQGMLPPADAVRIEELVNYFGYRYPAPAPGEAFSVSTEVGPAPWDSDRLLLHIGIQGARLATDELPPANLVFLVDVSGSMNSPAKLGLLKASMKLLVERLGADDRVAIAVYAGAAGTVLEPTPGDRRATIEAALERLTAGGPTNGGAGIGLAYALARQSFIEGGINRVILATDGDFNVGTTDETALEDLVERQRESGVALTALGFGAGNYNDALMQRLAEIGDGNAAYIDTLSEGRKVLVDELASTLSIIARDVKIQVEFNPAVVAEYRLIGYQSRLLAREDFNDDRVDAGEIGVGHTVTALYELALQGSAGRRTDDLRYADARIERSSAHRGELAFVRLRHKHPADDRSRLQEHAVRLADARPTLAAASDDFRFSGAVAGFGSLLRGGAGLGDFTYDDVMTLAGGARGPDPDGYRSEFLSLVRTARALAGPVTVGQR